MGSSVCNQRGNIAIVMALSIFGLVSGLSLSTLLYKETIAVRLDSDRVQQFFFLRSEGERGQVVVQKFDALYEGLYLPEKFATIIGSHTKNTYSMQSRIMSGSYSACGSDPKSQDFIIKSLITMKRGALTSPAYGGIDSMVRSYSERTIHKNTFACYQYFTDIEESTNETPVFFWGPDVLYGKVHSNTDIWIKQGGGGCNGGWPTFYGTVYTAGEIKSYSGLPPYHNVFMKGYFEHVSPLDFAAEATEIQAAGRIVGPASYDSNRIMYVKVNGNTYTSQIGQVCCFGVDTTDVWTSYPPPQGQYLFRNRFAKYDTIWATGPSGYISGTSAYIKSKLWLKGSFAGAQTWCSKDTLYLNGSCTLANTTIGQPPDGGFNGLGSVNNSDFLGIVSEKSIVIQYGFKDPVDSTRQKPNCGSDADGIWIYAALCALGDGRGNSHKDGVFTFEYQHPHPSVPAVRLNSNPHVWDKIDLHRRQYPQSYSQPWPANIDYPRYNPLWPEAFPYLERGTIHIFGSIAQRRSGYVHRTASDPIYPNPSGIWSIPNDFCGGASGIPVTDATLGITMNGVNAPNATGNGIGYKKDYHFDSRFNYTSPPDFPKVHTTGGSTAYAYQNWYFKPPPRSLTILP